MANYLAPSDLSRFLRNRSSVNARIAADFVDDHPDHPDVAWCVDRLEELARAAGLVIRHDVFYAPFGYQSLLINDLDWVRAGLSRNSEDSLFGPYSPRLFILLGDFSPLAAILTAGSTSLPAHLK